MLSLFFCPKPFTGEINIIQRNAIGSWKMLRPEPEISLIGDEADTHEVCREFGIRHIPEVERNEYGTPLVSSIFKEAQKKVSCNIFCYINADIILTQDFIEAVALVKKWSNRFLMIGRRRNVNIAERVNFDDPDWVSRIKSHAKHNGTLYSPKGIDYFVFTRGVFTDVLPFAIGRASWDCWLVYHARYSKIPVIDATQKIWAIHQNHEYAIEAVKDGDWNWDQKEIRRNFELAKGSFRDIGNATHKIRNNRICKKNLYLYVEPALFSFKKIAKKVKTYFINNGKNKIFLQ